MGNSSSSSSSRGRRSSQSNASSPSGGARDSAARGSAPRSPSSVGRLSGRSSTTAGAPASPPGPVARASDSQRRRSERLRLSSASHWCHECNRGIRLTEQGTCPHCGGGFVEEATLVRGNGLFGMMDDGENPAVRLVTALQAVTELGAALDARRVPAADNRIEQLIRELQASLRIGEGHGMRAILQEDVVGNTSYTGSAPQMVLQPLRSWDGITTVHVATDEDARTKIDQKNVEGCAICCCPLWEGEAVDICILPICKHEFHKDCLESWFGRASSCPICRRDLNGPGGPWRPVEDPGPGNGGE